MPPPRRGALGRNVARELARASARGCRRKAARRAPQVLTRSGRTTEAVPGRAYSARAPGEPGRHRVPRQVAL